MAFQVGKFKSPALDAKKAALEAAKAASGKALGAGENSAAITRWVSPDECSERIRIVFDDSGSISSQVDTAKQGVVEFNRNCIPNQTAVAVHFMNTKSWSTKLRTDLPTLSMDLQEVDLNMGSTPFFNTLKRALEATPKLTRLVAFTDGSPTDQLSAEGASEMQGYWGASFDTWIASANVIITIAHAVGGDKCIPIDTVYFGPATDSTKRQMDLLRYLSEKTGGYFLHFDPAKVNFKTAFKYLAPVNRLQLTSGSFRASLERGEQK